MGQTLPRVPWGQSRAGQRAAGSAHPTFLCSGQVWPSGSGSPEAAHLPPCRPSRSQHCCPLDSHLLEADVLTLGPHWHVPLLMQHLFGPYPTPTCPLDPQSNPLPGAETVPDTDCTARPPTCSPPALCPLPVSYTHLTLPTILGLCRSRWSPYH